MKLEPENQARLSPFPPGPAGERLLAAHGIRQAWVFSIPMRVKFRGITVRDGLIFQGKAGMAEAAPFWNYGPEIAATWVQGAFDMAARGLGVTPRPVPVNVTVPVVDPDSAAQLVRDSGCHTAKVKVADPRSDLADDLERVRAVRAALGTDGAIRVDANMAWTLEEAREALPRLHEAAGGGGLSGGDPTPGTRGETGTRGLQYAEQPCKTLDELVELQEMTGIPVAADESIRLDGELREVIDRGLAAAVIKAMPLGGPARAARIVKTAVDAAYAARNAPAHPPLLVVSSALDTGVGLTAGLALATHLKTEAACGLGTARLLNGHILTTEPGQENGWLYPPKNLELCSDLPGVETTLIEKWRHRFETIAAAFDKLKPVDGEDAADPQRKEEA